jgi:hypothetical protein
MKTITDKVEKKKINWLFPDENPEDMVITEDDFREMVQEAESQPGYSYQEHIKIVNEWLKNHQ